MEKFEMPVIQVVDVNETDIIIASPGPCTNVV